MDITKEMADKAEDSWAQVELYRWQYGELPTEKDCKQLDVDVALEKMAEAIKEGCKKQDTSIMPSPYNVCSVLRYISRVIKAEKEKQKQN